MNETSRKLLKDGFSSTSSKNYLDRRQDVVIEAQAKVVKDYKGLYQTFMKPYWNPSERFVPVAPRNLFDENGEKIYDADGEELRCRELQPQAASRAEVGGSAGSAGPMLVLMLTIVGK